MKEKEFEWNRFIYVKTYGHINEDEGILSFTRDFPDVWNLLSYLVEVKRVDAFRVDYLGCNLKSELPQWGCVISEAKKEGADQKHYQAVEATDAMAVSIALLRLLGYSFE